LHCFASAALIDAWRKSVRLLSRVAAQSHQHVVQLGDTFGAQPQRSVALGDYLSGRDVIFTAATGKPVIRPMLLQFVGQSEAARRMGNWTSVRQLFAQDG
jgi:hypothetical protein